MNRLFCLALLDKNKVQTYNDNVPFFREDKRVAEKRRVRSAKYLHVPHQQADTTPEGDAWAPPVQAVPERMEPQAFGFVEARPYDPMADAAWAEDAPPEPPPVPQVPGRARGRAVYIALSCLCLLALSAMGYAVVSARQTLPAFQAKQRALRAGTFFEGVYVDGVPLGGMTMQQAEAAFLAHQAAKGDILHLTVEAAGRQWTVTENEIPFTRNADAVLKRAYAIGRKGFVWMGENALTPFETRWQHTLQTKRDGAHFTTRVTYQAQDVRRVCREIAAQVDREAVNAVIATFDYDTRAFTVTQDVPGVKMNAERLYEAMQAALDTGRYDARIAAETEQVLPLVTSVSLQNGFARLSEASTKTTDDQKRNTNISLAARAITGTCVMPGETFSFNASTGRRTAEKGYQPAPAIYDGATQDEIGGGVCQVSSTLFNAAAMADMTILARSPHAWPSSYIDKGLDATVNWPNLDFRFRNDKGTPVFIVARYEKRTVTVEMYGMRSYAGESIALETRTLRETPPETEPEYRENLELPPGTQEVKRKARTGYLVQTDRVYLRDGQEIRRETLCTSDYRAIRQLIEFH